MKISSSGWTAIFALLSVLVVSAIWGAGRISWGAPEQVSFVAEDGLKGFFRVRLADTPAERARGLMFVKQLPLDEGMLFLFGSEQRVSMYMKNTYVSLDMWFIGADGRVEKVHAHATPGSLKHIRSEVDVVAVLEVNSGLSDLFGIKKGARVYHPAFDND